jgi:hypothetical protein
MIGVVGNLRLSGDGAEAPDDALVDAGDGASQLTDGSDEREADGGDYECVFDKVLSLFVMNEMAGESF